MLDKADTIDEIGDNPENYEGIDETSLDSPEEKNLKQAFYGDDEDDDYLDNDSDPSTTILKEFEKGVNSSNRPSDEWVKEDEEVLEEEEEDSY